MALEEQRLEKIREIISNHRGKSNAIAAHQIATMAGIPDDDTVATTRGLITKLVKNGELIGAHENGYFMIETEEELNEYVHKLNERVYGITSRIAKLIINFENLQGRRVNDEAEIDEGEDEDVIGRRD